MSEEHQHPTAQAREHAPAGAPARQSSLLIKTVFISVASSILAVSFLVYGVYHYRPDIFGGAGRSAERLSTSAGGEDLRAREPIVGIVEAARPAVVSVVITKDVPVMERYLERVEPFGGWGPFGSIEVPRVRQNGTEEREVGGGTGFFVSNDGMLVTNKHVVEDTEARYSVVTNDGKSYDAEVLVRDPQMDIAILKVKDIPSDKYSYLGFGDSSALKPGQTVIAIGNALAEFRNSVSVGVVSGLSRSITAGTEWGGATEQLEGVIQTDAAINPGNSGGPLLDLSGKVIGVNVAVAGGAENIGFALPANMVASAVSSVEKFGEIRRAYLGVRYMDLNEEIAKNNDLSVDYGAWVRGGADGPAVLKDSPAAKAGLAENDIIIEIDGTSLKDEGVTLASLVRQKTIGSTINVVYMRGGERRTASVTLESMPKEEGK